MVVYMVVLKVAKGVPMLQPERLRDGVINLFPSAPTGCSSNAARL